MREVILYVAGGAMQGTFSAGVLHALSEKVLQRHVSAVYGVSAGAFNAAHFAMDTTDHLRTWYCEHIPGSDIIRNLGPVALARGKQMVDTSLAEQVLVTERLFDAERLSISSVPISFGAVDFDTGEFTFLDARRPDALKVLLASTSIYPFGASPVELDGHRYVDGAYGEIVCLARLRALHPHAKIIILLNNKPAAASKRNLEYLLLRLREASLAQLWLTSRDRAYAEYLEALSDPDVLLVEPPQEFTLAPVTTDAALVQDGFDIGYNLGKARADEIIAFCDEEEPEMPPRPVHVA